MFESLYPEDLGIGKLFGKIRDTDKAYTISLAGGERTFAETAERDGVTYTAQVTGSTWVRVLPRPFDGGQVDELGSSRLWPTRAPT